MSMIPVRVGGLAIDERTKSPVVLLQEIEGSRVLPIWIGPMEASAIHMELLGKKYQRPLTHDLMINILEGLNAKVSRVVITDLKDSTFFANIYVDGGTGAVAVDARPPRSRTVAFVHSPHAQIRCATCHASAVTLDPALPVKSCTACHEDHHSARRDCAGCHSGGGDTRAPHADSVNAHESCDACHGEATVARLVPDRGLCLTCHAPQREHYATRECTTCHFLATPDSYRAHLRKAGA